MSNLPEWKSASEVYSRSYRILAAMAANGHVSRSYRHCSVSQDMRDFIEALNKGNEEQIKYWNLRYLDLAV